jgi:hypothetical protein
MPCRKPTQMISRTHLNYVRINSFASTSLAKITMMIVSVAGFSRITSHVFLIVDARESWKTGIFEKTDFIINNY